MNIDTIIGLAQKCGQYAVELEEKYPEDESTQVKEMTVFSSELLLSAIKDENAEMVENWEYMLEYVSEWIGNLMLAVTKNTYLYVYNYSKKKIQTNFQAYGIKIEF